MDSRLSKIAEYVPRGSRVADVGTDHAYLAIALVESKKADFVIASDKNQGPLEAAQKNVKAAKLEDKIELRLGDGLKVINAGEVEIICIAGMGGALIKEILTASPEVIKQAEKLILQPMNAVEKVRRWIKQNNWRIEDEDLAEVDGIIYEVLSVAKGQVNETVRTKKMESALLPKFIKAKIERLKRVLEEMSKSPTAVSSEKYLEIKKQIAKMEGELNEKR